MIFKFHVLSWYSTVFDMSCENPRYKLDHKAKKPKGKISWHSPYKYKISIFILKERNKERIFIYLSQCTQQFDCMTHLRFHEF